jgi:hypothetical protein
VRRIASDEVLLQPENSPRGVRTYDNEPVGSNEGRSYENLSRPHRQRPPSKKYFLVIVILSLFE